MPFASNRKIFIRELEIMILLADEDDDEKAVKKLVKLHELVTCKKFINDRALRRRNEHFFRQKFEYLTKTNSDQPSGLQGRVILPSWSY